MAPPLFISFEGIDGSGKTTQAENLHKRLQEETHSAILVREPGSTPLGESLRALLKGDTPISALAELFLFEAARTELVSKIIVPAITEGSTVITDRYTDSTIAYQGGGRELDINTIRSLNNLATHGLKPDVTFLISSDPKRALRRVSDNATRYEQVQTQDTGFYQRIANAYTQQAERDPTRVHILDGSLEKTDLAQQIWHIVTAKLNAPPP